MGSHATAYTLAFLCLFYALLGGMELVAPLRACIDGLAGPLTGTGSSPEAMCAPLRDSPAGQLVIFGLGKYHALFSVIALHALVQGDNSQRQIVLALNAINFALDDAWAAVHLHWINAGPLVLLPQAALVVWLVWLATSLSR